MFYIGFCVNIHYVKYKRYEQTLTLRQPEVLIKLDDSKFNVFYTIINTQKHKYVYTKIYYLKCVIKKPIFFFISFHFKLLVLHNYLKYNIYRIHGFLILSSQKTRNKLDTLKQ